MSHYNHNDTYYDNNSAYKEKCLKMFIYFCKILPYYFVPHSWMGVPPSSFLSHSLQGFLIQPHPQCQQHSWNIHDELLSFILEYHPM